MNSESAIEYGLQKMREIGKRPEDYHWEEVLVFPTEAEYTAGKFNIIAYNELYILVDAEKYFGIFILADNSAFDTEKPYKSGVQEFTGIIRFQKQGIAWYFDPIDTDIMGKDRNLPMVFIRFVIH